MSSCPSPHDSQDTPPQSEGMDPSAVGTPRADDTGGRPPQRVSKGQLGSDKYPTPSPGCTVSNYRRNTSLRISYHMTEQVSQKVAFTLIGKNAFEAETHDYI